MIRTNIIGFKKTDPDPPRWGDCTVMNDRYIIDGYCGIGQTRLVSRLKKRGVKDPVLFITHAHYDHYKGIRTIINDTWFTPAALYMYDPATLSTNTCDEVRNEIKTMNAIVSEAKKRGIPIIFLKNGDHLQFGDIRIDVYRDQPAWKGNSDVYLNDGSLCFWFPDLLYLTTGDAGLDCAKKYGLKPVMIKIGHHGNDCPRDMATWLYNNGCRYCWDNDISGNYTQFLMTGREDCIGVGMTYFNCIGDLNFVAAEGKMTVYKDGKAWLYKIPYSGKNTLKGENMGVVQAVIHGDYGNSNDRITGLLDDGYDPVSVQEAVNEFLKNGSTAGDGKEPNTMDPAKTEPAEPEQEPVPVTEMNGIDISNHQGTMDLAGVLDATKTDFVIVKATEGITFVDRWCDKFYNVAKAKDKQLGFYHFARPELNSAKAEAEFFLQHTSGYIGEAIPILDWESSGKKNVAWAKEWLDIVYQKTGVKAVIYMSESVVNAYNWKAVADAGYGLWVAKYKDYTVDRNYDMSTAGKKPVVKWWPFYMMWQWTSVGRLNGYSGNLDCDVFYGSVKQWQAYVKSAQIITGGVDVEKIYGYTSMTADLPLLRLGAKCNAVRLVQMVIGATVDGDFGAETEAKLIEFEKKYGLVQDALVDETDWKVILDWLATT